MLTWRDKLLKGWKGQTVTKNRGETYGGIKTQNEVDLFEIKVGLLQRERQTKIDSQISSTTDIRFWEMAVERFFVVYCFCQQLLLIRSSIMQICK